MESNDNADGIMQQIIYLYGRQLTLIETPLSTKCLYIYCVNIFVTTN